MLCNNFLPLLLLFYKQEKLFTDNTIFQYFGIIFNLVTKCCNWLFNDSFYYFSKNKTI